MTARYQIIFKTFDDKNFSTEDIIYDGIANAPTNILDFGIRHKEQMELIFRAQSKILQLQASQIPATTACPDCNSTNLVKRGFKETMFFDLFSDHNVKMQRVTCNECGMTTCGTVIKTLGGNISGELAKLHSELGARHSYRESEVLLDMFSGKSRAINNHDRVQSNVETIGLAVANVYKEEDKLVGIKPADELIIQVDGGHVKSSEDGARSFEAMAAVIYRPESIIAGTGERNTVISKHCSASTQLDNQHQMKQNTIVAALKEGLSPTTKIVAICDGADNCWNIVDAVGFFAANTTRILDWFHISMKHNNIAVPHQGKGCLYYTIEESEFLSDSHHLDGIYKVNTKSSATYYQVLDGNIIDLKIKPEVDIQNLKNKQIIQWDKLIALFDGCSTRQSQYEHVLWKIWHGKPDDAIELLNAIIAATDNKTATKLTKFLGYIKNNIDKVINYEERSQNKQVFTSSFAESTVESLINQRCKGKQHMRWTREGLDPVLQIRAAICSNNWDKVWATAVLNAVSSPVK